MPQNKTTKDDLSKMNSDELLSLVTKLTAPYAIANQLNENHECNKAYRRCEDEIRDAEPQDRLTTLYAAAGELLQAARYHELVAKWCSCLDPGDYRTVEVAKMLDLGSSFEWLEDTLAPDDAKFFGGLPDNVDVWQACVNSSLVNPLWSTDRASAEKLARLQGVSIDHTTIPKGNILMVCREWVGANVMIPVWLVGQSETTTLRYDSTSDSFMPAT